MPNTARFLTAPPFRLPRTGRSGMAAVTTLGHKECRMSTVVRKADLLLKAGIVTIVVTLVALFAVANAAESGKQLSSADAQFVEKASRAGNTEVLEARLALKQGSNEKVKEAARQLEMDHNAANEKLQKIAAARGKQVSRDPAEERKTELDQLRNATGQQFDREYVRTQVVAHRNSVELFEKQAKEGEDPELKAFAAEVLPTIKHHLEMMKELERKQTASK
jgi:putative membrane protein